MSVGAPNHDRDITEDWQGAIDLDWGLQQLLLVPSVALLEPSCFGFSL